MQCSYALIVPWELEVPGGVTQVVTNLYDSLDAIHGVRPLVLINRWDSSRLCVDQITGRRIFRYRLREPVDKLHNLKAGIMFLVTLPIVMIRLLLWINREEIAVVNIHYPGLWGLPFGLLRKWLKKPPALILSLHGMDFLYAQQLKGMKRRIWEWFIKSSDGIVACSEALAAEIRMDLPIVAEHIFSIHNGVDPKKVLTGSKAPEIVCHLLEQRRRYIACVATFERKKGQDLLIKSFASIAEERPDLDLVLPGRRAAMEKTYSDLAIRLGVADRVHFLPDLSHQDAMAVMRDAIIMVLPSRYEPFGIVLLEAGLHGIPVVATSVGGIKEIIIHDIHGLLVPPDNVEALAYAIVTLLDDPQRAQNLAEQLRTRVQSEFTWRRAANHYLRVAGLFCDR